MNLIEIKFQIYTNAADHKRLAISRGMPQWFVDSCSRMVDGAWKDYETALLASLDTRAQLFPNSVQVKPYAE